MKLISNLYNKNKRIETNQDFLITARKLFIFLSKKFWFFETSDDDDDGVDAFLSTFILSPIKY